ncbi:MAG TPA: metallophosphoesterase [Gemmatimonadales bacterium]|jgi:predicted MPP superfamily phosphohydrolase|nr:metallophosphoesterase [Gemmatimonadales bacterium]
MRDGIALIYLVLFIAPQAVLYLYLRDRLPDPARPRQALWVRRALVLLFAFFNFPWVFVARRVLFGSVWSKGWIPYIGPWVAWQMLGWIFLGLVAVYVLFKGVVLCAGKLRPSESRTSTGMTRRQFLIRGTYAYAGAGFALSAYGLWEGGRLPEVTRRTLYFDNLPAGLDGLRILHLSDVHAGIHMRLEKMRAIVAQANALAPDLVLQTGDMIDISTSFIPDYVRAFRDLHAPLGVLTSLGNHDHYTGAPEVITGVRDAGQVLVRAGSHLLERNGATLAILGIDDPLDWRFDDPQTPEVREVDAAAPPEAFKILMAHRPGAWDAAVPRAIPLTLSGHIHGGQLYLPGVGWSAGRLITKYVMGHFQRGASQLYVSRGIGVVGVPIRVFVPPEIGVLELRRLVG